MQIDISAMKCPNPFNPGAPVDPNDFVGRVQELENFKQKLQQTFNGSIACLAVAGGYGVGKTSFLHKCKIIAESEGALTIYFSLNELKGVGKDDLSRVLIERVRDKVQEEVILNRISNNVLNVLNKISVSAGNIQINFDLKQQNSYPTLQSSLLAAWGALKNSKKAIVFLIDEAGILEKNRGELLLYLRAILEQLQTSRTPVMFIPAGKLSIFGQTGTGFSPLVRTFSPVILENFTKEECIIFIKKKLSQAKISISDDVCTKIYQITEGHPFVLTAYLHTIYSKMFDGESELKDLHLKAADIEFVTRILSPFFSRFYDYVGRWSRQILSKIAETSDGEILLSQLTTSMKKDSNQLSPFLAKLVQDGALIRIDRGKYKLFHHLLASYIKSHES